jgi:outer membrane receptor protein involved in Fe transport
MNKFNINIALFVLFTTVQFSMAQVKEGTIGSEVVNIVKPYTPTISDAFKVKEIPVLKDEDEQKKETIQYRIFSFPVASTFAPSKGKAAALDPVKKEKRYDNYATIGFGNYGTANAELFLTKSISNSSYFGVMLRHLSSQGGIKNLVLEDKYANSSVDVAYGVLERNWSWNLDLGLKNQMYNWYGLPNYSIFTDAIIEDIDSKQNYNTIALGGKMALKNSFFKEASLQFKHFSDAFGSAENRFFIKPQFDFKVMDQKVKTDFVLDYVGGNFERRIDLVNSAYNYSALNFGFSPSIFYQQDDLSVQLGASVFYAALNRNTIGMPLNKNSIYMYPNIKASYKLVGDILVAYAGAEGGLQQNSYADFVDENPFVSPTLFIEPTDTKYDIYAGLNGKLANSVSFHVKASLINQDNKALFLHNQFNVLSTNTEGYAFGNSFRVVYDNLKTMRLFGELKAEFSKNISFGINGAFSNYSTDMQSQAWNLPQLKLGSSLAVTINEKWYAGAHVFYVGERKDLISVLGDAAVVPPIFSDQIISLPGYFDINAHVGYQYNSRLSAYVKGNNLANQQYDRWANFPVQGIQVLLGANYKFDF